MFLHVFLRFFSGFMIFRSWNVLKAKALTLAALLDNQRKKRIRIKAYAFFLQIRFSSIINYGLRMPYSSQ